MIINYANRNIISGELYSGRGAEVYHLATSNDMSEVREIVALIRGSEKVLELAAGSGRLTIPIARVARQVTAVDQSFELLAILRQRLIERKVSNVKIIEEDIFKLKLKDKYEIVVLGTTTVALFDKQQRQLLYQFIKQRLCDGGSLILSLYEGVEGTTPIWLDNRKITIEEHLNKATCVRTSVIIEQDEENNVVGTYAGKTHCISIEKLAKEVALAGFLVEQTIVVHSSLRVPNTQHHILVAVRNNK